MPWIVGIDEAGYGPNLGPLVMSSVACRVPEEVANRDLWTVLDRAVRRLSSRDDGRILVEDSKLVYSTARGLLVLETSVVAALTAWHGASPSLRHCLDRLCPKAEVSSEIWYTGQSSLPAVAEPASCTAAAERLARACEDQGVGPVDIRSVLVCAPRFNALVDETGSKGTALAYGLTHLVSAFLQTTADNEPVSVVVDKHGGRNTYAAMLQQAIPDGFVFAREECMERSLYEVAGLGRDLRLRFQPRADQEHFCVALASMVSKYLRELLMGEFNQFWQAQVPGLKATAGYPGDATRFFEEIRAAVRRLGVKEEAIWRRR